MEDTKEVSVSGQHGRDVGKTFHVLEVPPRALAGYVLRLVAALNVESYEWLVDQVRGTDGAVSIDVVMSVLQGCDPQAVHGLMNELLDGFVRISPDPQHPGARRTLLPDDIREMRTLGDVLMAFGRMHFDFD